MKNKLDIEAKLYIWLLHLKEENKIYTSGEISNDKVYVFNNYKEYRQYFINNGYINIDDEILKICNMKTTKKGTIICLKKLCDYVIGEYLIKTKPKELKLY